MGITADIGSALAQEYTPAMARVPMADITRVMQGIVSGIGFLGAGAILKSEKGRRIEGVIPRVMGQDEAPPDANPSP